LKAFEGNQADGDGLANVTVSHTVPAMAGLTYDLSVWNKQKTNFTAGSTFFDLDFLNGGGAVLSTELGEITTHPKDGSWVEFSFSALAPTDTKQATVRLGIIDGVDAPVNPQSAMFDDVSLSTEAIPEPSAVVLGLLALSLLMIRRRRG
jgi:hypothetical protein